MDNPKKYTQKELYQFVTEYSREARDERFDMSVGDFVDWIASRDEKEEKVCEHDGDVYPDYTPGEVLLRCCVCNKVVSKCPTPPPLVQSESTDKPVLPEKLEDPCYVQYGTESEREMLLLIVKLIRKQNEVLDYLKEKNI